jgi:hypothetical protein
VFGIWIGQVEIFRGTTPFTDPSGIGWHVDKDITEYSSILLKDEPITIVLPNYLSSGDYGVIYVSANLTFYESSMEYPPPLTPDLAIPLSSNLQAPWFITRNTTFALSSNLNLPPQVRRLTLEVYATPHSPCDEFWYAPDLTGCGSSPFREIRIFVDGLLVSAMLPPPIMYSGALNPALWKPVPSIDSLDIPPQNADLTSFLGVLVNGGSHVVTLQILNYQNMWRVDGNLLCYLDHKISATPTSLGEYDAAPDPVMNQTQLTVGTKVITTTLAQRQMIVSGTVGTSAGNVTTVTKETESFNNTTVLDLISSEESIYQLEVGTTNVTAFGVGGTIVRLLWFTNLMNATFNIVLGAQLTHALAAYVKASLNQKSSVETNGTTTSSIDSVDSVQASTLGPTWTIHSEKTTEDFQYLEYTPGCVGCGTSVRTSVTGDRNNVGLTGLEFLLVLFIIFSFEFAESTRRLGVQILRDLNPATSIVSFYFAYSKYLFLAGYRLDIPSFLVAMSPELAATVVSTFLMLLGWKSPFTRKEN